MMKDGIKEFSISKEGVDLLENIRIYKLNNFNLKEIYEKGKLKSTREEYEISLTKNKENIF